MGILVISLRALGDMVLITPIFRLLKNACPFDELTVVVDSIGHEVFLNNPRIDRIFVIDRIKNRRLPFFRRIKKDFKDFSNLRSLHCEVAIDLFGGPRSSLMTLLSGASKRLGGSDVQNVKSWFYTHCALINREGEHLVEQKLKIIQPLVPKKEENLPLELFLTDSEKEWGLTYLKRSGMQLGEKIVGFFPGAGWEHRQWPADKWAELGDRIGKDFGVRVVLIGGVRDQPACKKVSSLMSGHTDIFIQGSIRQTMSIINHLDLFISNDTGPMHIGVALGCPTIALFGPSNKIKYGPWGGNARIISKNLPCSPCPQQVDTCWEVGREKQECMKLIDVQEVYQTTLEFLSKPNG